MQTFVKTFNVDISSDTKDLDILVNVLKTKGFNVALNPFVDEESHYNAATKTTSTEYIDKVLVKANKLDEKKEIPLTKEDEIFLEALDKQIESSSTIEDLEEEEAELLMAMQKVSSGESYTRLDNLGGAIGTILFWLAILVIIAIFNADYHQTTIEALTEVLKSPWNEHLILKSVYMIFSIITLLGFVGFIPVSISYETLKQEYDEVRQQKDIVKLLNS